jgi:3',5'-cyclic AMP phosphodiesterase CpdA
VTWILHLSDPHLGVVSPGQELDDPKVLLDRQRDIETTQRVFRRTLQSLRPFVEGRGKPDAVVVSGDLTYKAGQEGFDAFTELLADEAALLPDDRARIVVVPGNHDVVWNEEPSSEARYEGFLAATRGQGCTTPLIDGRDFSSAEPVKLADDVEDHPHVISDERFLIVPINSSNYCGAVVEIEGAWDGPQWEKALEALGADRDEVLKQLKTLRQHDIARVSRFQVAALQQLFDRLGLSTDRTGDDRVRIAVLHHQLLPVSAREELKTFESLVNLGFVRQMLREFGFDLVLHGHKHESALYWDFARRGGDPVDAALRRLLVVASPGHFRAGTATMRALTLRGSAPATNVDITTFDGVEAYAGEPQIGEELMLPLWLGQMESESAEQQILRGATTQDVYSRLRALYELRGQRTAYNLVCEIDGPGTATTLPPDYPPTGSEDEQAWFSELVAWWQLAHSRHVEDGVLRFNHGERVYRRWGDQVERAVRLLNERDDSSRALIALISPKETGRYERDTRPLDEGTYPAFALAEFGLASRDGHRELDCFGYFRKQEMQYWWPVNVAELALLQEAVLAGLKKGYRARPGRLVTFSAIAQWRNELPRVAVPEIDRAVEHDERLWQMAAAIAYPGNAEAGQARRDWQRILRELGGTGRETPPVPARGHRLLLEHLERAARLNPSEGTNQTLARLRELCQLYDALREAPPNPANRELIQTSVAQLEQAVDQALGESAA